MAVLFFTYTSRLRPLNTMKVPRTYAMLNTLGKMTNDNTIDAILRRLVVMTATRAPNRWISVITKNSPIQPDTLKPKMRQYNPGCSIENAIDGRS